jgi:hypothetical protein
MKLEDSVGNIKVKLADSETSFQEVAYGHVSSEAGDVQRRQADFIPNADICLRRSGFVK